MLVYFIEANADRCRLRGAQVSAAGMNAMTRTRQSPKNLQSHIALNLRAIKRTVPIIEMAIDDWDDALAIEELENLLSQVRGLQMMVEEAKTNRINLTDEEAS